MALSWPGTGRLQHRQSELNKLGTKGAGCGWESALSEAVAGSEVATTTSSCGSHASLGPAS